MYFTELAYALNTSQIIGIRVKSVLLGTYIGVNYNGSNSITARAPWITYSSLYILDNLSSDLIINRCLAVLIFCQHRNSLQEIDDSYGHRTETTPMDSGLLVNHNSLRDRSCRVHHFECTSNPRGLSLDSAGSWVSSRLGMTALYT